MEIKFNILNFDKDCEIVAVLKCISCEIGFDNFTARKYYPIVKKNDIHHMMYNFMDCGSTHESYVSLVNLQLLISYMLGKKPMYEFEVMYPTSKNGTTVTIGGVYEVDLL